MTARPLLPVGGQPMTGAAVCRYVAAASLDRFAASLERLGSRCRKRAQILGWPTVRLLRLAERDGWVCGICERPVPRVFPPNGPLAPSRDHIIPRAAGGGSEWANLRLAHRGCNSSRGDAQAEIGVPSGYAALGTPLLAAAAIDGGLGTCQGGSL
jgi:hypothetical protein